MIAFPAQLMPMMTSNSKTLVSYQDTGSKNVHVVPKEFSPTFTIFKQALSGLQPFGDLELPGNASKNQFDLFKLASFYIMAVCQGDHYNTGVFGPLPVLGTGLRCLVITSLVEDDRQPDIRLKNKNYLMCCFFYPGELDIQCNRSNLEKIVSDFFTRYRSLEQVEEHWHELKIAITNHVFSQ